MDYTTIEVDVTDNRRNDRWDEAIIQLHLRGLNGYRIFKFLRQNKCDISKQTVYNKLRRLNLRMEIDEDKTRKAMCAL